MQSLQRAEWSLSESDNFQHLVDANTVVIFLTLCAHMEPEGCLHLGTCRLEPSQRCALLPRLRPARWPSACPTSCPWCVKLCKPACKTGMHAASSCLEGCWSACDTLDALVHEILGGKACSVRLSSQMLQTLSLTGTPLSSFLVHRICAHQSTHLHDQCTTSKACFYQTII